MSNLTRFDNDGIEIFIDGATGESFASIRGAARMAGKDDKTIRKFITADKIDVIIAQVPTMTGLKTADLLSERSICKILAKYNPDRLEQFAMLGIRTALHQIVGYQNEPIRSSQSNIYGLDVLQIEFLAHCYYLEEEDLLAVLAKTVEAPRLYPLRVSVG